jgi:hypothetical protein
MHAQRNLCLPPVGPPAGRASLEIDDPILRLRFRTYSWEGVTRPWVVTVLMLESDRNRDREWIGDLNRLASSP